MTGKVESERTAHMLSVVRFGPGSLRKGVGGNEARAILVSRVYVMLCKSEGGYRTTGLMVRQVPVQQMPSS